MSLRLLIRRAEFANPQTYNGEGEVWVAIVACLVWFGAIVLRLGFSDRAWTVIEKLVEAASFVVFAGAPIFFFATRSGSRFAQRVLLKNAGFWFQISICGLLGVYISLVKVLSLNPNNFLLLNHLQSSIVPNQFWLNTALLIGATFVVLRIPFLFLDLEAFQRTQNLISASSNRSFRNIELLSLLLLNSLYIGLINTSAFSDRFQFEKSNYLVGLAYIFIFGIVSLTSNSTPPQRHLRLLDFLLFAVCLLSLFWFSMPRLNFGLFISLNLFVLVIFHGLGLQREHFGYSFQVRSRDIFYTIGAIVFAFLVLVPVALILKFGYSVGTVTPKTFLDQVTFFLSYIVLFSFRVGIFEEVLFRSGLMTLIRDQLQQFSHDRLSGRALVLASALICSVIFGLCHVGNDPAPGSALSPLTYKFIYAGLATIASMFYALAFGETNRLAGAIVIHGVVDTTAVVVLGAALTVPF